MRTCAALFALAVSWAALATSAHAWPDIPHFPPATPTLPGLQPPSLNRINSDQPDAVRCRPIPPDECVEKRRRALDRKCISLTEFNVLESQNDTPVCDFDEPEPTRRLTSWCSCGCFAADTRILTSPKASEALETSWTTAKDLAADFQRFDVATLDASATLGALRFARSGMSKYTAGAEEDQLFVLRMADGRALKLTGNHAVLRADGVMIATKQVAPGTSLVSLQGDSVAVVAIDRAPAAGDVYNFLVATDVNAEHTLVAEGFVVGDLAWQNNLHGLLGAIAVRQ